MIGLPGSGDVNNAPTDLLTSSVNKVFVSAMKTTDTGAPLIQVGGNVEQGDSGGPALGARGPVLGIVSFSVFATSGSNSFFQARKSAKQIIQTDHNDTTPPRLPPAWDQASNNHPT